MRIYLACGLTHVPRPLFPAYVEFIHSLARHLKAAAAVEAVKYALVDSDPQLAEKPWADRPTLCYAWDRRMVEGADLIVADASFPSTGLGVELQIADGAGKPVIMLIGDYGINRVASARYKNPDDTSHQLQVGDGIVSLMALGLPAITKVIEYTEPEAGIAGTLAAVELFVPI